MKRVVKEKERIEKTEELIFIRKKWRSMSQEKLKIKLKLEYEMNENDKKIEMFDEEEKDLIIAMALGDWRLKLKKETLEMQ
jgi:hypothetical protein